MYGPPPDLVSAWSCLEGSFRGTPEGCISWRFMVVRRAVLVEGRSQPAVAREFGISRESVRNTLRFSVPPGYQRQQPIKRPKLGPWLGVIDAILAEDKARPAKQRHTVKRIFERLREEHGFQLSLGPVLAGMHKSRNQAPQNKTLYAKNQRRGRTLHPDCPARVDVRKSLGRLRGKRRTLTTLDRLLQPGRPH